MAQVGGPIHANTEVLGFYHKQKSEFHFNEKTDNEFLMFLLDTAVRVISIVQHLAPVIEAVSDASVDAIEDLAEEIDETNEAVSEFRGSTNTMDVDELSSINREVDDIIQLPPEPNPPPAHLVQKSVPKPQQITPLAPPPSQPSTSQQYTPQPVSSQQYQQPASTSQQYTTQSRQQPLAVPVQIPAAVPTTPAQYSTQIPANSVPVSLSVSETPAPAHPAPAPQSSSQATSSSSTSIPEPAYSQYAPAAEPEDNSITEVKPEAVPEVVTIKDELVEPMQHSGGTDSQLLPQSTINQLMNTLQSNEDNIGVANLVTTAQPSSLSSTFLDKTNNPLSMLSLSNTTSSINNLFPGNSAGDAMPGSSRGGELKSLMDNKAGASGSTNPNRVHRRKHLKKRMSWMSNLGIHRIHEQYEQVLKRVNLGESIVQAVKYIGIAKSTFYKWRSIAELKILDPVMFGRFKEAYFTDVNLLLSACRAAVGDRRFSSRALTLQSEGKILDQ